MTGPKNENERIIARISAVEHELTGESAHVLTYIQQALSPVGLARRDEWDQNVTHLHEVARTYLKDYEEVSDD